MTKEIKIIYNLSTGEIIEREMTDAEALELKTFRDLAAQKEAEAKAVAEAKETTRATALAKLAALGLSADEIAAL